MKEKLGNTKMTKSNIATSYLTRIQQAQEEIGVVEVVVLNEEFVRTTLRRFSKPYATFVMSV